MAATFKRIFRQDLTKPLQIYYNLEPVFSKDNLANEIQIELYNGSDVYSGGGSVSGTAIRADGRTVPIENGTISGNVVTVALTEECMDVPGTLQVYVKLTSGNVKTTIFAGVFTAIRTETGTVIDPGTIIPSITELINQIDAAIDSIPADYSTLLGSVAGTYSASKTYAVGDYVWYNGQLYRCSTAITTAEVWTAAHWTSAVISDDVTGLKSAVIEKAPAITEIENGYKHENVNSFTMHGNPYAFGTAKYADKKNLIVSTGDRSTVRANVDIEIHDNIIIFNGTNSTGGDDTHLVTHEVDMPIGSYIFSVTPYSETTTLSGAKSLHLDLWYDGNETSTQDKRVSLSVNDTSQSITFTTTDHVYKILVWYGVRKGTYNDYRLFYSLFPSDVTIVDTGETISSIGTLEITTPTRMAVVDTLMHKSSAYVVVDTKSYVDEHIDFIYFRPEDYGAKGDGVADDSAALQACINAAQAYEADAGKAIRGYGTYKITTGIVFNCRELDVYLHKLNYTGNDAAVTISASYSRFVFHSIRAFTGGSAAVGIRCKQLSDNGIKNTFFHNVVQCDFIACNGNTVELTRANGVTLNTMMYNKFYFMSQRSYNANIIEIASPTCNENDFYGKYVGAPNGFLVHYTSDGSGNIRVFHYCLEHEIKNGTNGCIEFFNCRFAEMMNLQTRNTQDKGFIYVWDNISPDGLVENPTGSINLTAVNVTNARSWNDCLNAVKAEYDNGAQSSDEPWRYNIKSIGAGQGFAKLSPVRIVANANMTTNGGIVNIPEGEMIVYHKNIAFKPHSEIYYHVTGNMTILLSNSNDWIYITPTVFDIDTSSATITLDASYCCIAINRFDVIQHAGKTAIVVDKLGNTIFDGTNLGEGVFHFKCELVQYQYGEVFITMENGTVKNCPRNFLPAIYSGENEKWTVTKEELIEAPAS